MNQILRDEYEEQTGQGWNEYYGHGAEQYVFWLESQVGELRGEVEQQNKQRTLLCELHAEDCNEKLELISSLQSENKELREKLAESVIELLDNVQSNLSLQFQLSTIRKEMVEKVKREFVKWMDDMRTIPEFVEFLDSLIGKERVSEPPSQDAGGIPQEGERG